MSVLLEMAHGALGGVDGDMGEVGPAEAFDLGVQIGKVTTLQQGIVGVINATNNILRAESYLFCLRKKIVDHPIKD